MCDVFVIYLCFVSNKNVFMISVMYVLSIRNVSYTICVNCVCGICEVLRFVCRMNM